MQEKDFKWFVDNYKSLYRAYGNSFLAIKNERVLGAYNTYAEAVKETEKSEKIGTFIVQECNGSESAYTNHIATVYIS